MKSEIFRSRSLDRANRIDLARENSVLADDACAVDPRNGLDDCQFGSAAQISLGAAAGLSCRLFIADRAASVSRALNVYRLHGHTPRNRWQISNSLRGQLQDRRLS